jgi:hypothetical protein
MERKEKRGKQKESKREGKGRVSKNAELMWDLRGEKLMKEESARCKNGCSEGKLRENERGQT